MEASEQVKERYWGVLLELSSLFIDLLECIFAGEKAFLGFWCIQCLNARAAFRQIVVFNGRQFFHFWIGLAGGRVSGFG